MLKKEKEIHRRNMEHKENKTISGRYYSMEKVTVTGFCNFCRNNIPLIIAVSISLFFTYGIKLFWHSTGIDTELFMSDKPGSLEWSVSIGRFGYALLAKLWYIKEFNPFTAFFTAFCLIWFFTISWCYIIAVFSKDTVRNNKLIPFALMFMTMPVWAEQFYFLLQAAENALIISLCPYIIYLLFKGFLDNEKGKIICASILLVFIISVYQAIVLLFCCGVFACFVLLQEYSDYKPQIYRNLCLKLFITLIGSLAVYFFIDRIIIPAVFHIERHYYLDNMIAWGRIFIRKNIVLLLLFIYTLTIGHVPLVQNMMNPIIARYALAGMQAAEFLGTVSRTSGNILLLPATIGFLVKMILIMRKTIPSGRRLLYMLAGIGIPLCTILMALMGGSWPPMRSHYALPFASAFMLFYLIRTCKKKTAIIVACLSLLTAVYQAESTAQLFYTDQLRYNEDVRFAYDLNDLIMKAQPRNRRLPVALIGQYQTASRFHANFLRGEIIGESVFTGKDPYTTTTFGLSFMRSLGINFDVPDENRIDQAFKEAALMPPYPDPGCVKRTQDFIVVRLAETLY